MLRDARANRYLQLDPPEYYSDRIMVGDALQGAVAGANSAVDLYNDTSQGLDIYPYSFILAGAAGGGVSICSVKGHASGSGSNFGPLNPFLQQRAGQIWSQTNVPIPAVNWHVLLDTSGLYEWPYSWPLTSIPAGYSLRFQTDAVNVSLRLSIVWLVSPPLGKAN